MKIGIIGATGQVGSLLLAEAVKRQLDVTAIVRSPQKVTAAVPILAKDLFALTKEDLAPFDVVIDAFNAPKGHEELHETSLAHLTKLLQGTTTRLLVVGGASSLFVDEAKTKRMIDGVSSDAPFYPTAHHMVEAFLQLKATANLHWLYLSPAVYFYPHGAQTGHYQLGDDQLKENAAGKSEISMADYALAMLDLAAQPEKEGHFSVYQQ